MTKGVLIIKIFSQTSLTLISRALEKNLQHMQISLQTLSYMQKYFLIWKMGQDGLFVRKNMGSEILWHGPFNKLDNYLIV